MSVAKKAKIERITVDTRPSCQCYSMGSVNMCQKPEDSKIDLRQEGSKEGYHKDYKATVFIVKEGIQNKRFCVIHKFASNNGFICEEKLSERKKSLLPEEEFTIPGYYDWLSQKMQQPLKATTFHMVSQIQEEKCHSESYLSHNDEEPLRNDAHTDGSVAFMTEHVPFDKDHFNSNMLERNAPLKHFNLQLMEPLAFLSDYWIVMGDERRSLAYAKAAATIKCLPFPVTMMEQVIDLKGIGTGHSLKVLQETLETGTCREMVVKKDFEKYKVMKSLTGVYGIGSSLAEKLYSTYNIRSVQDIIRLWNELNLSDERIKYGLAYYADLNSPVPRESADKIKDIVKNELDKVKAGCTVEIAGGFRRGKLSGHDVDLLIRCNKKGEERGVLSKLLKQLKHRGYILQEKMVKSTYDDDDEVQ
ncbi:DNA-directed DNA/RNA polymerase mu-like isoform X2 [Homarus americanus]|uniref:DNA-directed DNA/RNA polymerase mu-like isoform X2 n=1 Tax=Homarus americanus TaxID=6706 RepID=UPI001C44798E|nr:DNA-directed DNA/RNA polymerase mu-like isoform X2 [Homarus americanus]